MLPDHLWVIPVAMKLITPNSERCQCFVADPDCRSVNILIECALEMPLEGRGAWLRARMAASRVSINRGLQYGRNMQWLDVGSGRTASSTPIERAYEAHASAVSTWPWAPTAAPTAMSERIASAPRQGMLRRAAPALDSAPRQAPVGLSPPASQLS
jgi:hypothetical protein